MADLENTKPVTTTKRQWRDEVLIADPEHYVELPNAYEFSRKTFKDRRDPYENFD